MKLKKWLSRGLVLAMVLALMVPVPVAAAKSSGGGKQLKSVTYYKANNEKNRYEKWWEDSFTYNKKGRPTEIKFTDYKTYFAGVPMDADVTTTVLKYKGNSMKKVNQAGITTATYKFSKGKVVSYVSGGTEGTYTREDGVEVESHKWESAGTLAYGKNGLMKAGCDVTKEYYDGAFDNTDEWNGTYFVTQKKGIPSYIFQSGTRKTTYADGTVDVYAPNSGIYETYNSKGLVVQSGQYDGETNKYTANTNIQYKMKKGKVAEAYVFTIGTDGKETLQGKYVFKYTKKSVSKQKYMSMINDYLSDFAWFWY